MLLKKITKVVQRPPSVSVNFWVQRQNNTKKWKWKFSQYYEVNKIWEKLTGVSTKYESGAVVLSHVVSKDFRTFLLDG